MTLRLILTRHAKSSWDDPLAEDHARVLNARGRASATAIGKWLTSNGYLPQEVLCSDAVRTAETWALIAAELPDPPQAEYFHRLYHAPATRMLATLAMAGADTVLMVGHNPGIGDFASGLAATPPAHPRFHDYPTAATTIFDFDADSWADVRPGTGRVVDFTTPRDLIG
ncbi:histidine phosphatase family protein [Loktanella sp. IMCC34160]|uniref:SixA phosphatase family protein n=1 Tax=Loktanella sp. IMCC34160 TaxID=2510646 RepID=UPI00101E22C5|nr:histidine phosphatase family protein [Loktanella sp. IMCC34160]RYG92596.1 histidine phosphatase family protein [Loktanella sp. IMCC34160]